MNMPDDNPLQDPSADATGGNGLTQAPRPHLPVSTQDLHRKTPRRYSIRQEVEDVWERLYNGDQEFRELLEGGTNEESAEGSLRSSNISAAKMIRDASDPDSQLRVPFRQQGPGLEKIWQVLNTVLKDWEISRKDQRENPQFASLDA